MNTYYEVDKINPTDIDWLGTRYTVYGYNKGRRVFMYLPRLVDIDVEVRQTAVVNQYREHMQTEDYEYSVLYDNVAEEVIDFMVNKS